MHMDLFAMRQGVKADKHGHEREEGRTANGRMVGSLRLRIQLVKNFACGSAIRLDWKLEGRFASIQHFSIHIDDHYSNTFHY